MAFGKRSVFGGATGGEGTPVVALNLTALMDILSNILFFLLAAYAAQATSQVRLQLQLTISITQQLVQVADAPVARIEKGKLVKDAVDDEGTIPSLYDKLVSIKQRRDQAGREQTGEASGILLLADKDTDADVVSKVLKTAGRAGFVNVRFGVVAQ
jgi:biopolymer transport protein ExbD